MLYPPSVGFFNSLQLVYLSDQFRHIPRNIRKLPIQEMSGMNSVISYARLCKLHKHVLQASYYAPLSNKNFKPMCHLFSKVLNVRCHGRLFPILALRYMHQFKTTHRSMLELFVMSLLGNYPHIAPSQRPKASVRARIYELFVDSPDGLDLFAEILKNADLVIVNALREFIIFSIDMHPWLKKHLTPLMNLEKFTEIVGSPMSQIRKYFSMFLCHDDSALFQLCTTKDANALGRVLWDLNWIIFASHKGILDISYRRPNLNHVAFIAATRKKCPLIKIPTQDDIHLASFKTDDERLQYELERDIIAMFGNEDAEEIQPEEEQEEDDDDGDDNMGLQSILKRVTKDSKKQTKSYEDLEIWQYVDIKVYQALQAVVQRERPTETGSIMRCVQWLTHFGISTDVKNYINRILLYYEYDTISDEQLKIKLQALQKYEPYAYTLIHITAELIKQCERHYTWFQLPYHYLTSQIKALTGKYSITKHLNAIIESNIYLVFCDVCGTDYSLIRVFANKVTGKKIYNQYYRLGFRDVVVEYATNEMYCKGSKCNTKGKCGDKPLVKFPLLGRALFKNGKCYLICTQPDCGLKMEYDATQCAFTNDGVACSDCTKKLKENPPQCKELESKYRYNPKQPRRCLLCHTELVHPHSCYLLPAPGLYLCKSHVKAHVIRDIIAQFGDDASDINADELLKFIVHKRDEYKLKYKARNEAKNRRALQITKIKNQNRRVRR
jgi:hypothetical protein